MRLNKCERAVQAFETCLYFEARHVRALMWLGRIHLRVYKDDIKARDYFKAAAEYARNRNAHSGLQV